MEARTEVPLNAQQLQQPRPAGLQTWVRSSRSPQRGASCMRSTCTAQGVVWCTKSMRHSRKTSRHLRSCLSGLQLSRLESHHVIADCRCENLSDSNVVIPRAQRTEHRGWGTGSLEFVYRSHHCVDGVWELLLQSKDKFCAACQPRTRLQSVRSDN